LLFSLSIQTLHVESREWESGQKEAGARSQDPVLLFVDPNTQSRSVVQRSVLSVDLFALHSQAHTKENVAAELPFVLHKGRDEAID